MVYANDYLYRINTELDLVYKAYRMNTKSDKKSYYNAEKVLIVTMQYTLRTEKQNCHCAAVDFFNVKQSGVIAFCK